MFSPGAGVGIGAARASWMRAGASASPGADPPDVDETMSEGFSPAFEAVGVVSEFGSTCLSLAAFPLPGRAESVAIRPSPLIASQAGGPCTRHWRSVSPLVPKRYL